MLGVMTGRAIYSLDGGYATPLPIPFEDEQLHADPAAAEVLNDPALRDEQISGVMASYWIRQSEGRDDRGRPREPTWLKSLPINSGLCYLYYCDLTVISQEIINRVYSTNSVILLWSDIESRLEELKSLIDLWLSTLPKGLDFTQENAQDTNDQLRYKTFLAFQYYSTRITLGRPCLYRRNASQNNSPQTFSHSMAVIALESASRMLDLIPDEPNILRLYEICPWWKVLRYLMQAATIILLELSSDCVHMPDDEAKFVQLAKKCIRWFYAMSEGSMGSRRAWQFCDSIFRKLANGMKYTTDDIPALQSLQQAGPNTENISQFSAENSSTVPSPSQDYFSLQFESPAPSESHSAPEDIWANYFNLPTPDLMWSIQGLPEMAEDSYFPHDPVNEEFIRSLFTSSEEESQHPN